MANDVWSIAGEILSFAQARFPIRAFKLEPIWLAIDNQQNIT